jgi:hypothetical protein
VGEISISLSDIIIGIESSLIMFPINLIILLLFLKVGVWRGKLFLKVGVWGGGLQLWVCVHVCMFVHACGCACMQLIVFCQIENKGKNVPIQYLVADV